MNAKRRTSIVVVTLTVLLVPGNGLYAANNAGTKVLRFPSDRVVGKLSMELTRDPSSGPKLDPARLALESSWEFIGLARGDVVVPADRNISLSVDLESGTDKLAGLSQLGPSDLYNLTMYSFSGKRPTNGPSLESISHLTGLQILSLGTTGVTAAQMASLKSLRSLRALVLVHELSAGSAGLAALKDLPALEYLDCDTNPTDTGLKHVGQIRSLRQLRVRMGRVKGPGLLELANLPHLERLCLWSDKAFGDEHVRYLEGLTNLKSLTLWGSNARLTDATLTSVSKLSSLEEFYLIRVKKDFTDAGFGQLTKLANLRILDTAPGDAGILAGMKQLESVNGVVMNRRNMKALASLPNLKSLGLSLTKPWDKSTGNPYAMLGELKSLEKLHVRSWGSGTKIFGDEELALLESAGGVKDLSIPVDNLTDRGLASIGKLKQLESLNLMRGGENIRLSTRGLNHLNNLSKLENLSMNMPAKAWSAGDNTPLNLSALKSLKKIDLVSIRLRGSDWAFLSQMKNLEELWLNYCGVCSENGLTYIKGLPELKELDLQNVNCTKGDGLTVLDSLKKLHRIRMLGRVTDRALARVPAIPSVQMFTVQTDVPIRPETIARLEQNLPAVRTVNVQQPTRQTRSLSTMGRGPTQNPNRSTSSRRTR